MNKVYVGRVVLWKHGFGFLAWEKDGIEQPDIFVHYTNIDSPHVYKRLSVGDLVMFEVDEQVTNEKGVIASNVKAISQEDFDAFNTK